MGLTTFPKPPRMKYTDMAIYIDKHISEVTNPGENPDVETLIYQYLYHLYYALSCKAHYFKKMQDYDSYALYAAAQTFLTLRDRWQHKGEIRGDKKVEPIKSSLNYVKTLLYPFKVNYQQAEFMVVMDPEKNTKQDTFELERNLRASIQSDYNWGLEDAFTDCIEQIPRIAWKVVHTTPYRRNRLMCHCLYISCLLSLISSITLSQKATAAVDKSSDGTTALIKQMDLNNRRPEATVLWHLSPLYTDYVKVLVARIKQKVDDVFTNTKQSFELTETVIDDILNSAYATYEAKNEAGDF